MACLACGSAGSARLCPSCLATLAPAPEALVDGLLVRSAFTHDGAARRLVHRLKYEGLIAAADLLAAAMDPILPADASVLVPVPRVWARRWRYGVDPAWELARALARRRHLRVVGALRPMPWTPRRAGPAAKRRGVPRFSLRAAVPRGAVLVDDVVTTGVTLAAARRASGIIRAVTATSRRR